MILTDEEIAELKRDYCAKADDLIWWEAARAIENAVIDKIKANGAVAYINCNSHRIEWAVNTKFATPRTVDLPPIPLYVIGKE